MKKILFLLLLSGSIYAQNPTRFERVKITANQTSATATKVNVQEADGTVNTKPLSEFGSGTVSSVTGINGVTVASGTTTPVIGLGNITPITATTGNVTYTPAAAPTYAEGKAFYDSSAKTLVVYDDISGTSTNLGQELNLRARNNTGVTIANGAVVYISGATGQNPTIALARANSLSTSVTIGIATHDIANNTIGKITTFGLVNDLNTSSFADGQVLYLSPTTAGILTSTVPGSPNYTAYVCVVLHSHITQGKIFVRPEQPISLNVALTDDNNTSPSVTAVKSYADTKFGGTVTINTLPKVIGTKTFGDSNITDTGSLITLNGLNNIKGTTASDTAPLGSELTTTGSGANWSGTGFATGYTHTAGSTATLTTTLAAVIGSYYQITYTISGRTAGTINIDFGGTLTTGISATGNTGPLATSTASLSITPTSDFNGTLILSVKIIGTSSATTSFLNSSGIVSNEIRASNMTGNTFFGRNSGIRNTTGANNTFSGANSGQNTTTGSNNTFFGLESGINNTTGSNNSFYGLQSGRNNTMGFNNSFYGLQSGRFISDGTTPLTNPNNSIFIGQNTKALADNGTNEIVIGDAATGLGSNSTVIGGNGTTKTRIRGKILQGTDVDNGIDAFQTPGTVSFAAGTTSGQGVNKGQLDLKANLASPTFTGIPTAPTAAAGTNTTQIATTAFVAALDTGNVKLTGTQIITGQKNFNAGILFVGTSGIYSNVNNNAIGSSLYIETSQTQPSVYIQSNSASEPVRLSGVTGGKILDMGPLGSSTSNIMSDGNFNGTSFNGGAALTGTPTAPTAAAGTNTTQIATTGFVTDGLNLKQNTISGTTNIITKFGTGGLVGSQIFDNGTNVGIGTSTPVNKLTISDGGASGIEFNPASGDIFTFNRQTSLYTPMVFSGLSYNFTQGAATFSSSVTATSFNGGAALTGIPTAPTATAGTNTTQIATTAFVIANAASSGKYTPVLGAMTNVTSVAFVVSPFTRIGNVVSVRVTYTLSVTASLANSSFQFTIPVDRVTTTTSSLEFGTGVVHAGLDNLPSYVVPLASANGASLFFKSGTNTGNHTGNVVFTYLIDETL